MAKVTTIEAMLLKTEFPWKTIAYQRSYYIMTKKKSVAACNIDQRQWQQIA